MPTALGDILQYKMSSWCDSQLGLNVLHYKVTLMTGSPPTLAKMLQTIDDAMAPLMIPMLSSDAQYLGASLQHIQPLPVSMETFYTVNAAVGGSAPEVLPKQTALVLTKQSTLAGRANRGRLYIPFPSEGANTTLGIPAAAYLALAATFANQMASIITVAGTTGLTPIIYQRKFPGSSQVINTVRVNNRWGNQRRRGDYGRLNPQTPA
jgi:hypothetical protein